MKARFLNGVSYHTIVKAVGVLGVTGVAGRAIWNKKQADARLLKNQMRASKINNAFGFGREIAAIDSHHELVELLDQFTDEELQKMFVEPHACRDLLTVIEDRLNEIYANHIHIVTRYVNKPDVDIKKTNSYNAKIREELMAVRDKIFNRLTACMVKNIKTIEEMEKYFNVLNLHYNIGHHKRSEKRELCDKQGIRTNLGPGWDGPVFIESINQYFDWSTLFSSNREMFNYISKSDPDSRIISLSKIMINADRPIYYLRKAETLQDILSILHYSKKYNSEICAAIFGNSYPQILAIIARDLKNKDELTELLEFLQDIHHQHVNTGMYQSQLITALRNHPVVMEYSKLSDIHLVYSLGINHEAIVALRRMSNVYSEERSTRRLT